MSTPDDLLAPGGRLAARLAGLLDPWLAGPSSWTGLRKLGGLASWLAGWLAG